MNAVSFSLVLTGVLLTEAFRRAGPEQFQWRQPPYEYEHEKLPFDILAGSSDVRVQIEGGTPAETIAASWEPAVAEFNALRRRFLLY